MGVRFVDVPVRKPHRTRRDGRLPIEEAAALLGVPPVMLGRWAAQGIGPAFGGSPLEPDDLHYARAALEAWLEERAHG